MSANRFTHLQSRPYMSTYVPLPLDMMYQALANKQKAFDANVDDIKATQDLIKINADPNREGIRDQLLTKYNNKINELADGYLKTGDQSLMYKMNDLKKEFANDQVRLGLEKSAANYTKYQADIKKNKDEGTYGEGIGGYDAYAEDKAFDKEGNFKSFDYTGQLAKQDYRTVGQSLIGDIAKDSKSWDGFKIDKTTNMPDIGAYGQYWKSGQSSSGLGVPKILEMAEKNAENLINTKEGVWFVDDVLNKAKPGLGHVNYNDLPVEYKDYVKKKATDYLYSLGAKQRGFDVKDSNDLRMLSDAQLAKVKPPVEVSGTTYPGQTWHDPQIVAPDKQADELLNEDGTINKAGLVQAKGGDLSYWGKLVNGWNEAANFLTGEKNPNPYKTTTEVEFNATAKNMFDIAKRNGWDKDANGKPLTKGQTLQKTAAGLALLSTGADANYRPPSNIDEKEVVKRMNLDSAVDKDGNSLKSAMLDSKTPLSDSQLGFVFGGKDPKIQVTLADGTNKDYNITNTSYIDYLRGINNVVNTNNDVIRRKTYTSKDDMTAGNEALLSAVKNPELMKGLEKDFYVYSTNDNMNSNLKPISVKNYKGGMLYSYSDANKPGAIRMLYMDKDGQARAFATQSDFIQQESGSFFNQLETTPDNKKVSGTTTIK